MEPRPLRRIGGRAEVLGAGGHSITIAAKAPQGAFVDAQGAQDQDSLNAMMRALLIDGFKMAIHYEDRPMNA